MSITDFLFSLHKLLSWLLALLTVVLPQHLLAPLSAEVGTPAAAYAAAPQLCARTSTPPDKLARAALPPPRADDTGASASASGNTGAAAPASRAKR